MIEKIPPELESNIEQIDHSEHQNLGPERVTAIEGVGLSQKEIDEIERLEHHLKYEASKESKDENKKHNNAGVLYGTNKAHKQPGRLKKWAVAAFAGLLSLGASAKESKNPEDSLKNKMPIEKINPADSVEVRSGLDLKKYEQYGISRIDELKSEDSTKHLFLVSVEKYKNYNDMLRALEKAGLTPASTEEMGKALEKNSEIFKKHVSVISLDEVVNKLGKPSFNTINWDKKANTFHGGSREIDAGIDDDYDNYGIIVEIPVDKKDTNYSSGIAKNK
ncbi:MAG: hypothetical protein AAB681_00870 [Patescibacteria group bacterium]